MFNKKISLFLIILVFMLSVCAVSAADTNSTDDVAASDVDEEPPSMAIEETSADEVLAASNATPVKYDLKSKDVNMYYKGKKNYEVVLSQNKKPVSNAKVIVKINGVKYNKITNSQGKISIPINLKVGKYSVYAYYNKTVSKSKIKVLPVVSGKNVVKTYKSPGKYTAKFLDGNGKPLKNTKVKFRLRGKTYTKRTNSKGVAQFDLNLKVGNYVIYAIHPNGYKISNKITVKHSIAAADLTKRYASYKQYSAKFFGTDGKPLANKYITFSCKGNTFYVQTNSKGVATIKVISQPSTFKITSKNPQTGESVTKTIRILPTITGKDMTVFTGSTSKFKITLYKNEKIAKNTKLTVYVDGVKRTVKTDKKGVATVNFRLSKGVYVIKAVDPFTDYVLAKKVTVKLASVKAHDIAAIANHKSSFQAQLLKQDGSVAKNTKMKITIKGVSHVVKTNSKGFASVNFKLPAGKYKVVSMDLKTGYKVTSHISVVKSSRGVSYNKYGVSADGKTILAIGRPSAPGEESKYGYTWYMTEFVRTCPYCHGHHLYWDVFWAGDEKTEVAIFPATGNREPGSTEGMIFCADCDCDFSIFGNEHVTSHAMHLTKVSNPVKSSKEVAYILKSGNYVKI